MDVTYPFFPIASIISAFLLLLLLATSALRRSWNFGIFMICIGLLCENLTFGINSILWSANADIKHLVWCDLATHLQLFGAIAVPAGSLVVTRRLYYVAKRRAVDQLGNFQRRLDAGIEIFLLIVLPALYVGAFYYVVQVARFQVLEEIGCTNAIYSSGMSVLLLDIPAVLLPAISVLFYCPSILWLLYKQHRNARRLKGNEDRASRRTNYYRLFAIGCLDIALTLPINSIGLFLDTQSSDDFVFYPGWDVVHADWTPFGIPAEVWRTSGFWTIFTIYFTPWSNVVLSLAIVVIFGSSYDALDIYRWCYIALAKRFGLQSEAEGTGIISSLIFQPDSSQNATSLGSTGYLSDLASTSPNTTLQGKRNDDHDLKPVDTCEGAV